MENQKERKSKSLARTPKRLVFSALGTGFFVLLSILIAFPVVAGLLASFRPGTELIRKGLSIKIDPKTMTLSNYLYLFGKNEDSDKYFMWYKNSLIITVLSVVLTLFICYFVAYGLTMYDFKCKNLLFTIVIATMMVPFEILMLPMYKEIIKLGLIDTYAGVLIPGLCNASTIFFFRQYLSGLPKELLSAARIDGANEYYIAVKIILPLTKPAFASMGILTAMGSWNAILWPLLVLKDARKFTLPIGLNTLLTPYGNNYDVLIAGSMFGILPIFVIFLIFQKYIIDGMTAGAVKG
ncbi:MAG: carbohydrate ABC transporter permease [Lachnospiraceae bacterium]|nr:carbohydrate ABC transporter permease [Lachnospiraceae bacterium]